jgi:glycosyltransferase involved in cell wall biosynthesis
MSAAGHERQPVMGAEKITLSIVMPCLNEALTIGECVKRARQALADGDIRGEIIVADNGSADGSQAIAEALGAKVVGVSQKGYGHALRAGIDAARGEYVLMGDSDCSYDFGHAPRFVEKLREGFDLVMGNRFSGEIRPGAMSWKNRRIGNPVLSAIGRLFFNAPVRDFHCGLRAFSRTAYDSMDLHTGGMEFASEMVIKATLRGMKITEVPTTLSPDGRGRPPHLRPWRDGWRHLRFMLLYSPDWLFLYPGLIVFLLGLAAGCRLLAGPVSMGTATFDVHTLFFCSIAIFMGIQSMQFAILTKVYAIENGLLPGSPRLARVLNHVTLESGILLGAILLAAGLAMATGAFYSWSIRGFGALSPQQMLRWVIPSGTLLALGCQTILGSFFFSILGLKTNR